MVRLYYKLRRCHSTPEGADNVRFSGPYGFNWSRPEPLHVTRAWRLHHGIVETRTNR